MFHSFTWHTAFCGPTWAQLMPHFAQESPKKATLPLRQDFLQKVLPAANKTEKQSLTLDLIWIYTCRFGCPGRSCLLFISHLQQCQRSMRRGAIFKGERLTAIASSTINQVLQLNSAREKDEQKCKNKQTTNQKTHNNTLKLPFITFLKYFSSGMSVKIQASRKSTDRQIFSH